jgi:glycosyltransferase involved in cell wall biosynthesis
MNKVIIFSSDYPGIISGIGDYAYLLNEHLKNTGIDTYLVTTENHAIRNSPNTLKIFWKLGDIIGVLKRLKEWNTKLLIFQYPGMHYGRYSLVPHLYVLLLRIYRFKIITTLHEYSNVVFLRRISEWIFIICSHRVVVTSSLGRDSIINLFGAKKKTVIIPIGPNIPVVESHPNFNSNIIVTFGMIYPDKCVEDVIQFMELIERHYGNKFIFRFVGGSHIHFMDYFEKIKQKALKTLNNVELVFNTPSDRVHESIKDAFLAIQFYNDGASIRRGSLLGMISNGIPVVTNKGDFQNTLSTFELEGLFYNNAEYDVFSYINRLISDEKYYQHCSVKLRNDSEKYNFSNIAEQYKTILEELNA